GYEMDPDDCPAPLRARGLVFGNEGRIETAGMAISSRAPEHTVFAGVERSAAVLEVEQRAMEARVRGDTTLSDSLYREASRLPWRSEVTALQPAAAGFHVGLGRIVRLSDHNMLQNDVIRYCPW